MSESSNDSVIGYDTRCDVVGDEIVGPRGNNFVGNLVGETPGENIESQNQVIERNIARRVKKDVASDIAAVENQMHHAILTGMDNVVVTRIEMAVNLIAGSSGLGANCVVRNPDQSVFSNNMENTPLMTASSRTDLNINKDRN